MISGQIKKSIFSAVLCLGVIFTALSCGGPTEGKLGLEVEPDNMTLDFGETDDSEIIRLTNIGDEEINWNILSTPDWIIIDDRRGELTPGQSVSVEVRIDRDEAPSGNQDEVIFIEAEGIADRFEVRLRATIEPRIRDFNVSTEELDFGQDGDSREFIITNKGNLPLQLTINSPREWINVSPSDFRLSPESDRNIQVDVSRGDAPPGGHEIKLEIKAEGLDDIVEVVIKVSIPDLGGLSVRNRQLIFDEAVSQIQITLDNSSIDTLGWSASSDQSWIMINPDDGVIDPGGEVTVIITVDRTDLVAGEEFGAVTFISEKNSETASISVETSLQPELTISGSGAEELDFGDSISSHTLLLRNTGGGFLNWSIEASHSWIVIEGEQSGTIAGADDHELVVKVKREGLEFQQHEGRLTIIWGDNNRRELKVKMSVLDAPILTLSNDALDFGTSTRANLRIRNEGSGNLIWQVSATDSWLKFSPGSGTTASLASTIILSANRAGLRADSYNTQLIIQSNQQGSDEIVVPVSMEVPLPRVEIIGGPQEGEIVDTDEVEFRFDDVDAYGTVEFKARLDDGEWSEWSTEDRILFSDLEESSIADDHVLFVKVLTDAGESEPATTRIFQVDAIKGPVIRFVDDTVLGFVDDRIAIDVLAEEVTDVLGMDIVLGFDAEKLELEDAQILEDSNSFVGQSTATLVQPEPIIDNTTGEIKLSYVVVGGQPNGIARTGFLFRLSFLLKASGSARISLRPQTQLRDYDNQLIPIPILTTQQSRIIIE